MGVGERMGFGDPGLGDPAREREAQLALVGVMHERAQSQHHQLSERLRWLLLRQGVHDDVGERRGQGEAKEPGVE